MFKNYLRIALRHLRKHKVYAAINIIGLAIGLCCCLLILLFVKDEVSYDSFHQDADRIYRVKVKLVLNDVVYDEASIQFPAAEALKADIPEIEEAVRLYRNANSSLVEYENVKFTEDRFLFADSTFFTVFDFELVHGDAKSALASPNGVVITEGAAHRYFGTADPIGKRLTYEGDYTLVVTGVAKNPPSNSHFTFDFLAPMSAQFAIWDQQSAGNGPEKSWFWTGSWTYLLLSESDAAPAVAGKLPAFVKQYFPVRYQDGELALQPLTDIYLHSQLGNELAPTSHVLYVYIFSAIALLVLLIACINFTNLATAQTMLRAKEVGVRKSLGAANAGLRTQLLGESVLMSMVAVFFALVATAFLLPVFNAIADKQLTLQALTVGSLPLGILALVVVVGLGSGLYPALVIPRLRPVDVLKSSGHSSAQKQTFRKGLVVIQFALSISLMIGIGVIFRQMQFVQSRSLGFDKDRVVVVSGRPVVDEQFEVFRSELLRHPAIENVAGMSDIPGHGANGYRFVPEGGSADDPLMFPLSLVDHHFLATMDIDLEEGRGFSKDFPSDEAEAFVLNETAVQSMGWEGSAVGRKIDFITAGAETIAKSGRVVGVMKDFHFESLHHEIKPMVLTYTNQYGYYAVKLESETPGAIAHLEDTWRQFSPDWPLNYFFLDRNLEQLYSEESRLSQVVAYFALLAIFVASLGLFGLSSFTAARRMKEISIRKVLGANLLQNLGLLSREFATLILISLLIALPVSYVVMNRWLDNFAYHGGLELSVFLWAGPVALLIALATVSYQCMKVALVQPMDTLRHQ